MPNATETAKGKIRIATDQEVEDRINDETAITPKKIKKAIQVNYGDGSD